MPVLTLVKRSCSGRIVFLQRQNVLMQKASILLLVKLRKENRLHIELLALDIQSMRRELTS